MSIGGRIFVLLLLGVYGRWCVTHWVLCWSDIGVCEYRDLR